MARSTQSCRHPLDFFEPRRGEGSRKPVYRKPQLSLAAFLRTTGAIGACSLWGCGSGLGYKVTTVGGPHHMGTARMDASPTRGVVDQNCRVHGV